MYRFQIHAVTQPGETIALVGAISEMGLWDVVRCVRLGTHGDRYPLWWVDIELSDDAFRQSGDRPTEHKVEYKYVRIRLNGSVEWEALGANRWVPLEVKPPSSPIIVEDGVFGTRPLY